MIRQLPATVVQQIAAGEVIISPRNALKELLENALDADASRIDVQVKDNGFALLQVKDNGSGIGTEDLKLLCTRFATSKLKNYSDIQHVATLGFRGEALASISHVAHLSVVTKQKDTPVATRARYNAGKLIGTEKTAGLDGTTIVVENLFYNNPTRRQALDVTRKSEYAAILDTVNRYAIKYPGTFTCKQAKDAQPMVIPDGTALSKIESIYGSSLASHLLPVSIEAPEFGYTSTGYVSDLEYTLKSVPPIFFINGRLVEIKSIQRAIDQVYSSYGPKINTFVYLDISIASENVDINTHPTKQMVTFLFQDEIIAATVRSVTQVLSSLDKSRTYAAQTVLTSTLRIPVEMTGQAPTLPSSQRYEHKLVRTDPKQTFLAFSKATSKTSQPQQLSPHKKRPNRLESPDREPLSDPEIIEVESLQPKRVNLTSIAKLKSMVNEQVSVTTTRILAHHTLIGIVDPLRYLAAIQYDVKLYLADYNVLSHEFFYQTGLLDFSNYGTIHLGDGLSISQLLKLENCNDEPTEKLTEMATMLEDYFKIKIEMRQELVVTQMPLLLAGYTPSIARLPQFFVSINEIDWEDEIDCLAGILNSIASWCVPVNPSSGDLELIFSGLKTRFAGKRELNSALVEIASLPGLYKVFERC